MDSNLKKILEAIDYKDNYESKVNDASDYISQIIYFKFPYDVPEFGLVLGSGLGDLAQSIDNKLEIPFSEIPNFPQTTVEGHEGKLIIGKLEGITVIGLKGRKHYYEVADEPFNTGILQTVFSVHVLANLGVKNYFVTNAAGGLNLDYKVGDMMILDSHINELPNPLLGRHHDFKKVNNEERVMRFQPMNDEYNSELKMLLTLAGRMNFDGESKGLACAHMGTYLAVSGPSYETKSECIAFRSRGADAVGMSTANEVIVARNRGMNVVGFSCITNKIAEDGTNATNHDEVKKILESTEVKERFSSTVRKFFELYTQR